MYDLKLAEFVQFLALFFHNDIKLCIRCNFDKHLHYFLISDLDRCDSNRIARDFMQQFGNYQIISFSWYTLYDKEITICI